MGGARAGLFDVGRSACLIFCRTSRKRCSRPAAEPKAPPGPSEAAGAWDRTASTGGAQQPWESIGLGRRVYLTGQPPPAATQDQLSDALREWLRVDKTSIAELETFLLRHGSSAEADYARARLAALKKQQADLEQKATNAARQKAADETRAKEAEAERLRLAMLREQEAAANKKADNEPKTKADAERPRNAKQK